MRYFIIIFKFLWFCFLVESVAAKQVVGAIEKILIEPVQLELSARFDTGAKTASLSATDLKIFNDNGKDYVSFYIDHPKLPEQDMLTLPLVRYARIKNKRTKFFKPSHIFTKRPVVHIPVCINNKSIEIEVNLIDRRHFKYPMILGRSAIVKLDAVVDPAISHTKAQSC